MNITLRYFNYAPLLPAILAIATGSTASAGILPFGPTLMAAVRTSTVPHLTGVFVFDTANAPATNQSSNATQDASSSANFTALKSFAENSASGDLASAKVQVDDRLTVNTSGSPLGATRLEISWQLGGTITGIASAILKSTYRLDGTNDQPNLTSDELLFDTVGAFNQEVTFVYNDIPLGTPWNLRTELSSSVESPDVGISDFANSVTLANVTLYIDDVPVSAVVTGESGTTYAVPEPTSLAVLGLGGVVLAFRRRRIYPINLEKQT